MGPKLSPRVSATEKPLKKPLGAPSSRHRRHVYVSEGIEQAHTVVRHVDMSFLLALATKGRYESLEFLTDTVWLTFQLGTRRHDTLKAVSREEHRGASIC